LAKSLEISQRISHPRQNSSSKIGTFTVLDRTRNVMNKILALAESGRELLGAPTRAL
jgi:hypothetical protein